MSPSVDGEPAASTARRLYLTAELVAVFVGGPVAVRLAWGALPMHPFVMLWLLAAICLVVLRRDPEFRNAELWTGEGLASHWRGIVARFAIAALALGAVVAVRSPAMLFGFLRSQPAVWAAVMVLYPILSVYPQGLVYRSFLLHRYRQILPAGWPRLLASGLAFSLLHLVLQNPIALVLTFVGGVMFAWTHQRSRSLMVSSFEHALYGCFIFTIGWGTFFYLGSVEG